MPRQTASWLAASAGHVLPPGPVGGPVGGPVEGPVVDLLVSPVGDLPRPSRNPSSFIAGSTQSLVLPAWFASLNPASLG
jgi:hypothetical protein